MNELDAYHELCAYTLTHGDPAFIHQHVADTFAAQHATEATKPIALTFALAGLYLHVERRLNGRQVQCEHMRLAQQKREWPRLILPRDRGTLTAIDVLQTAPGPDRDRMIDAWCESVWNSYSANREAIAKFIGLTESCRCRLAAVRRNRRNALRPLPPSERSFARRSTQRAPRPRA